MSLTDREGRWVCRLRCNTDLLARSTIIRLEINQSFIDRLVLVDGRVYKSREAKRDGKVAVALHFNPMISSGAHKQSELRLCS